MTLTEKIALVKARKDPSKLVPVRMSPFVRLLNEKRLPAKVLYNGAWTRDGEGGAA